MRNWNRGNNSHSSLTVASFLGFALVLATSHTSVQAQITGSTRVANSSNVRTPIFATHAPGDSTRLFIAERGFFNNNTSVLTPPTIKILDLTTGQVLATPFLDSIPNPNLNSEGGLLGLAFHPNYAENGKFYVNVTRTNDFETFQGATANMSTHILEYTVSPTDPNVALAAPREILSFVQPQGNHNGGWIGFSPIDGHLYIATGDGGGGNDSSSQGGHTPGIGNAQDLFLEDNGTGQPARNLHGKMLRIELNGDSANPSDDFPDDPNRNYAIPDGNPFANSGTVFDDEIWAYGLRNPFRSSFDSQTGDLWIGDVGQGAREEIDFQPAGSLGGENYGWRSREGTRVTGLGPIVDPDEPNDLVPPVYEYLHPAGQSSRSVTGGVVYRGPDPTLRGMYFFADFVSDEVWIFDPADPDGTVTNINALLTPDVGTIRNVAAFGEDADGNIYLVDLSGEVFRIDAAINLAGDYNGDGTVNEADFQLWQTNFGEAGVQAADGNADGVVNEADYTVWRDNFGRSLANPAAVNLSPVPEPSSSTALLVSTIVLVRLCRRGRRAC